MSMGCLPPGQLIRKYPLFSYHSATFSAFFAGVQGYLPWKCRYHDDHVVGVLRGEAKRNHKMLEAVIIRCFSLNCHSYSHAVVKLDLTAVDGTSTGNSAGTLCVCLMKDSKAAATALERASRKLRHTPSVIVEASEIVSKSAPMTDDFEAALGAMTAKLELIVRIGDTVTQVAVFLCPRSSTQNCFRFIPMPTWRGKCCIRCTGFVSYYLA